MKQIEKYEVYMDIECTRNQVEITEICRAGAVAQWAKPLLGNAGFSVTALV